MLGRAGNWLLKSALGRQFSKSSREEFLRGAIIRTVAQKDYGQIVKNIHKFFRKDKPESPNKRKNASLSSTELAKAIADLKIHCEGRAYFNIVSAIDCVKNGKDTSKLYGSGGLLLDAKEVHDWTITNPEFMLGDQPYGLICDLFVVKEARRLGTGTKIVEALVNLAAAKEVKVLYAVVDAKKVGAQKCLTNNGFKEISKTDANEKGQVFLLLARKV